MEEKYISLKEAAEISGYAPDYIGQLIRSGKIPGKQVYTNITWMTTTEAVLAYKQGKEKTENKSDKMADRLTVLKRKIQIQIDILFLFFRTFKTILPILAIIVLSFFLLVLLLLGSLSDKGRQQDERPERTAPPPLSF